MPKKIWVAWSVLGTGVALLILATSLLVSSSVYRLDEGDERGEGGGRRFYLGREILPDHIFYQLLTLPDRSLMIFMDSKQRPWVELETAQRRLETALALQKADEKRADLVLLTLNKSHSYLLQGGEGILSLENVTVGELLYVLGIIEQRQQVLMEMRDQLPDLQRSRMEVIRAEEESLGQKIQEWIEREER